MTNKEFENMFLNVAVNDKYRERIAYELGSKKKREKAIWRFSHHPTMYLNLDDRYYQVLKKEQLWNSLDNDGDTFYLLSLDYPNGIIFNKQKTFDYLCFSDVTLVIGKHAFFIKEEPERQFLVHIIRF